MKLQSLTKRTLEREAHNALVRITYDSITDAGKGAYLRLFRLTDQTLGIRGLVELWSGWIGGNANAERRPLYEIFSNEKAYRTARNYQIEDHITSWESRDEKSHQYQGASLISAQVPDFSILGPSLLIVSVSGLSAQNDQRLGLLTVNAMGWAAGVSVKAVCERTNDSAWLESLDRPL